MPVLDFCDFRILVDQAPIALDGCCQPGQIFQWMKQRLIRESHARPVDARHMRHKRRLEPEIASEVAIGLQVVGLLPCRIERRMQESGDTMEVAFYFESTDNL